MAEAIETAFPERIDDEATLDEVLTRPSPLLVESVRHLSGPLVVLGAGGKMGPSLAVRAKRAASLAGVDLDVVAVSRFSDEAQLRWLAERGVTTHRADLFDRSAIANLPESQNVVYLVGSKFGTSQNPSRTWAVNTLIPDRVAERYSRSTLVALSTGNVYPLVPVTGGGSLEDDPLTPHGEYPFAAVARERIFDHVSRRTGQPVTLVRLNYAVELRYGVLVDIGRQVLSGRPVDVTTGYFNCLWQGDANDAILRCFDAASSPPRPLNLTGTETLSVREIAGTFGRLLDRPVAITGAESSTALLSNASAARRLLGDPRVSTAQAIHWTAGWLKAGGRLLDKPTHFEVRDGVY